MNVMNTGLPDVGLFWVGRSLWSTNTGIESSADTTTGIGEWLGEQLLDVDVDCTELEELSELDSEVELERVEGKARSSRQRVALLE